MFGNPSSLGWFAFTDGPSPTKTRAPRLPTYPTSTEMSDVSSRCTVTLYASTAGGCCEAGRTRAPTEFGSGRSPFDGTAGNVAGDGPSLRLKTASKFCGAFKLWLDNTGRFWVTVWPKIDPNTPRS